MGEVEGRPLRTNHSFEVKPNEWTGEGVVAVCRRCEMVIEDLESEEVASAVIDLLVEDGLYPATCEEVIVDFVHDY